MRYKKEKKINQLKQEIEALKKENDILRGIEETLHIVTGQRDNQMAITQEITFLLLYMESIQNLIKFEYSTNAKTIRTAIGRFKQELSKGFSDNHLIMKLNKNGIIDNKL